MKSKSTIKIVKRVARKATLGKKLVSKVQKPRNVYTRKVKHKKGD